MRSPFLFVNFVRPKISARHEEKIVFDKSNRRSKPNVSVY